ncbi:protein NDRG3 isoform X4 [Drosophila guanche]|uniref:Blast:Protein NDRG3 n=3 Tax=Drosophila guanche TaxID=7266 RepID=A0A3B0JPU5_DROGU|nr:protein NDRG3 isoform X4 [Drosophila guanche]XP_034141901.1 protein NDRG3 isoform X4 [Drosophila guanche]XP_034141902.1 protein NDRG3 isoform X4 [Drosophila guanche]SPP75366.1 blast:Protein NDRG3 [Drosophila guanche]
MPSAPTHTAEEAHLLGTMPVDPMDDIELRSVQLHFPNARGSILEACDQRRVPTDKGDIHVAIQGDTSKPAIVTYHDLGLNYATSFAGFFNFPVMRGLLENFCVYHVTAPGQEEGAPALPEDYVYPTMDELAAQLLFVLSHFGLKSVIGFGVGAGANILARFAHGHPDKVGALCLINCVSTQSGWIEWGYQSFNARFLRTKGMTQGVIDYLMWHHFGRNPEERNHDLVQMYKQHFERAVNPTNLAMLINAYIHRNDLHLARTPPGTPGTETAATTLKMPVINITGSLSPHVDDTVTFNGRLDPTNSSWMKISDCALVLEEQPAKLAEAFRLFLQGEGYATPLSTPASSPCGTKYHTYSSIFFANFREQQQQAMEERDREREHDRQRQLNLRIGNRLRETAINCTNNGAAAGNGAGDNNNADASEEEEDQENGNGNGNRAYVTTDTSGTLYYGTQSNKIRITENPLPEPVSS